LTSDAHFPVFAEQASCLPDHWDLQIKAQVRLHACSIAVIAIFSILACN
jgi:hypothetical protein